MRVGFADSADPKVSRTIRSWCACLERERIPGVLDWVPGYTTVTVFYAPSLLRYASLCGRLAEVDEKAVQMELPPRQLVYLPVCYGGDLGPDLAFVAEHTGMSHAQVIQIHGSALYRVEMIGFAPGFPYLSGLDPALSAPRLPTPRPSVPPGSVGIGGKQTGVYTLATPGGWRVIGRTPVRLFDPEREPAALLRGGDGVRFVPVDRGEYRGIETEIAAGRYRIRADSEMV